ncbi:hypothetical protein HYH03_007391 [Edaphochlamys debaryana]|uniref:Uncharacterized protein n=1 Tax=Edaphochlamys debaryana TaxID=47281 RepID=A0A835Y425_9CHLO|nr:hypothetical protein HYH03_007391 [Edaphochlamys debaryana]|eukprot:KAG2494333.1 hypothetical protein HYH03_007391 [Edaphochlamys debaryana]
MAGAPMPSTRPPGLSEEAVFCGASRVHHSELRPAVEVAKAAFPEQHAKFMGSDSVKALTVSLQAGWPGGAACPDARLAWPGRKWHVSSIGKLQLPRGTTAVELWRDGTVVHVCIPLQAPQPRGPGGGADELASDEPSDDGDDEDTSTEESHGSLSSGDGSEEQAEEESEEPVEEAAAAWRQPGARGEVPPAPAAAAGAIGDSRCCRKLSGWELTKQMRVTSPMTAEGGVFQRVRKGLIKGLEGKRTLRFYFRPGGEGEDVESYTVKLELGTKGGKDLVLYTFSRMTHALGLKEGDTVLFRPHRDGHPTHFDVEGWRMGPGGPWQRLQPPGPQLDAGAAVSSGPGAGVAAAAAAAAAGAEEGEAEQLAGSDYDLVTDEVPGSTEDDDEEAEGDEEDEGVGEAAATQQMGARAEVRPVPAAADGAIGDPLCCRKLSGWELTKQMRVPSPMTAVGGVFEWARKGLQGKRTLRFCLGPSGEDQNERWLELELGMKGRKDLVLYTFSRMAHALRLEEGDTVLFRPHSGADPTHFDVEGWRMGQAGGWQRLSPRAEAAAAPRRELTPPRGPLCSAGSSGDDDLPLARLVAATTKQPAAASLASAAAASPAARPPEPPPLSAGGVSPDGAAGRAEGSAGSSPSGDGGAGEVPGGAGSSLAAKNPSIMSLEDAPLSVLAAERRKLEGRKPVRASGGVSLAAETADLAGGGNDGLAGAPATKPLQASAIQAGGGTAGGFSSCPSTLPEGFSVPGPEGPVLAAATQGLEPSPGQQAPAQPGERRSASPGQVPQGSQQEPADRAETLRLPTATAAPPTVAVGPAPGSDGAGASPSAADAGAPVMRQPSPAAAVSLPSSLALIPARELHQLLRMAEEAAGAATRSTDAHGGGAGAVGTQAVGSSPAAQNPSVMSPEDAPLSIRAPERGSLERREPSRSTGEGGTGPVLAAATQGLEPSPGQQAPAQPGERGSEPPGQVPQGSQQEPADRAEALRLPDATAAPPAAAAAGPAPASDGPGASPSAVGAGAPVMRQPSAAASLNALSLLAPAPARELHQRLRMTEGAAGAATRSTDAHGGGAGAWGTVADGSEAEGGCSSGPSTTEGEGQPEEAGRVTPRRPARLPSGAFREPCADRPGASPLSAAPGGTSAALQLSPASAPGPLSPPAFLSVAELGSLRNKLPAPPQAPPPAPPQAPPQVSPQAPPQALPQAPLPAPAQRHVELHLPPTTVLPASSDKAAETVGGAAQASAPPMLPAVKPDPDCPPSQPPPAANTVPSTPEPAAHGAAEAGPATPANARMPPQADSCAAIAGGTSAPAAAAAAVLPSQRPTGQGAGSRLCSFTLEVPVTAAMLRDGYLRVHSAFAADAGLAPVGGGTAGPASPPPAPLSLPLRLRDASSGELARGPSSGGGGGLFVDSTLSVTPASPGRKAVCKLLGLGGWLAARGVTERAVAEGATVQVAFKPPGAFTIAFHGAQPASGGSEGSDVEETEDQEEAPSVHNEEAGEVQGQPLSTSPQRLPRSRGRREAAALGAAMEVALTAPPQRQAAKVARATIAAAERGMPSRQPAALPAVATPRPRAPAAAGMPNTAAASAVRIRVATSTLGSYNYTGLTQSVVAGIFGVSDPGKAEHRTRVPLSVRTAEGSAGGDGSAQPLEGVRLMAYQHQQRTSAQWRLVGLRAWLLSLGAVVGDAVVLRRLRQGRDAGGEVQQYSIEFERQLPGGIPPTAPAPGAAAPGAPDLSGAQKRPRAAGAEDAEGQLQRASGGGGEAGPSSPAPKRRKVTVGPHAGRATATRAAGSRAALSAPQAAKRRARGGALGPVPANVAESAAPGAASAVARIMRTAGPPPPAGRSTTAAASAVRIRVCASILDPRQKNSYLNVSQAVAGFFGVSDPGRAEHLTRVPLSVRPAEGGTGGGGGGSAQPLEGVRLIAYHPQRLASAIWRLVRIPVTANAMSTSGFASLTTELASFFVDQPGKLPDKPLELRIQPSDVGSGAAGAGTAGAAVLRGMKLAGYAHCARKTVTWRLQGMGMRSWLQARGAQVGDVMVWQRLPPGPGEEPEAGAAARFSLRLERQEPSNPAAGSQGCAAVAAAAARKPAVGATAGPPAGSGTPGQSVKRQRQSAEAPSNAAAAAKLPRVAAPTAALAQPGALTAPPGVPMLPAEAPSDAAAAAAAKQVTAPPAAVARPEPRAVAALTAALNGGVQARAPKAEPASEPLPVGPVPAVNLPPPPPVAQPAAHLPAASVSHLHGCLPPGVPLPPLQPGELRLCGLTFQPDLAPSVRRTMQEWEASSSGGGCRLAALDPSTQQISIPGVDGDAGGSEGALAASAAFSRHGLRRPILATRLARHLGIYTHWDAPLPSGPLPLSPDLVAPGPDPERGGAGLFARAAIKPSWVLGVVGGYVMPRAAAEAYAARGLRQGQHLQAAMTDRAGGSTEDADSAWGFLAGSFRLRLPGLGPSPCGADGCELSMLGYGNEAALVNDPRRNPRAWAPGNDVGDEEGSAANCMVLPVSVRGLVLPVLVALRDIAPGEQLLRDYGAEWWRQLGDLWEVAEDAGLSPEALLHGEQGAGACLPKPTGAGLPRQGPSDGRDRTSAPKPVALPKAARADAPGSADDHDGSSAAKPDAAKPAAERRHTPLLAQQSAAPGSSRSAKRHRSRSRSRGRCSGETQRGRSKDRSGPVGRWQSPLWELRRSLSPRRAHPATREQGSGREWRRSRSRSPVRQAPGQEVRSPGGFSVRPAQQRGRSPGRSDAWDSRGGFGGGGGGPRRPIEEPCRLGPERRWSGGCEGARRPEVAAAVAGPAGALARRPHGAGGDRPQGDSVGMQHERVRHRSPRAEGRVRRPSTPEPSRPPEPRTAVRREPPRAGATAAAPPLPPDLPPPPPPPLPPPLPLPAGWELRGMRLGEADLASASLAPTAAMTGPGGVLVRLAVALQGMAPMRCADGADQQGSGGDGSGGAGSRRLQVRLEAYAAAESSGAAVERRGWTAELSWGTDGGLRLRGLGGLFAALGVGPGDTLMLTPVAAGVAAGRTFRVELRRAL